VDVTTLRNLFVAALLLALAGCRGGGDDSNAASTSTSTTVAATTASAASSTTSASTTTSSTTAVEATTTTLPVTSVPASTTVPAPTTAPRPPTTKGTPRASIAPGCPAQSGGIATLTIKPDGLDPQCLSIYPDQSLKVVNGAEGDATLTFGDVYTTPVLGPGDFLTTEPVGTGLGRGKSLHIVCTCYPDNQGLLLIAR